jgi:hypothetical protein
VGSKITLYTQVRSLGTLCAKMAKRFSLTQGFSLWVQEHSWSALARVCWNFVILNSYFYNWPHPVSFGRLWLKPGIVSLVPRLKSLVNRKKFKSTSKGNTSSSSIISSFQKK